MEKANSYPNPKLRYGFEKAKELMDLSDLSKAVEMEFPPKQRNKGTQRNKGKQREETKKQRDGSPVCV